MPVKSRKAKSLALDEYCRDELLFGPCLLAGAGYHQYQPESERDTERMAGDWNRFREALLAEFVAAYPRERPYAWWLFDAPAEALGDDETQNDYLARHDLLFDGERDAQSNGAELHIGNYRPNPVTDERARTCRQ